MIFEIELSKTAEHLFNLAKKKYGKVARFSRFNASIKGTSSVKICEFMYELNSKYNLNLTITHQNNVIYLR
jgi:hypothetical protein